MSIEALGWAIKQQVFPSTRKFVLILLANYAGDNGITFPSIRTLSEASGMKEETISGAIDALLKEQLIEDTGRRAGATARVRVLRVMMSECNTPEMGGVQSPANTPPNPPLIPLQSPANTPPEANRLILGTGTLTGTVCTGAPKFAPPKRDECYAYGDSIGLPKDQCDAYLDYFESNGWKVSGKAPMKSWQASMRTWKRNAPAFEVRNGHHKKEPSILDMRTVIEAEEEKCQELARRYAHESPHGLEWMDQSKHTDFLARRKHIKELKEIITKRV